MPDRSDKKETQLAREESALRRRDLLKRGILAGLTGSAILTLAPEEARAIGSWRPSTRADRPGTSLESRSATTMQAHDTERTTQDRTTWIVPGSYRWRHEQEMNHDIREVERGAWRRFAHDD